MEKKHVPLAALCLFFSFFLSHTALAMTNEEFLALCSSTMEPRQDAGNAPPALREILQANKNLDVNFKGPGGVTPLMAVAANKSLDFWREGSRRWDCISDLLAAGARVNQQDENGATALMYALRSGAWPSTIQTLLVNGADPGIQQKDGRTAVGVAAGACNNPDIMGLLLSQDAYSGLQGKRPGKDEKQRLAKLAETNPNPQVAALVRAWAELSPRTEDWQPLFVALPPDQKLVAEIQVLDRKIRELENQRPLEGFDYLVWQAHLPDDLEALKILGRSEAEAWRETYLSYLYSRQDDDGLSRDNQTTLPARLIVQGNYGQSRFPLGVNNFTNVDYGWWPYFVLTKNNILVTERPGGLVGYELTTAKELWRNASDGAQYAAFGNLILSLSAVDDSGQDQIAVIDAYTGQTVWHSFSPHHWLTDPKKQFLIIITGYAFVKFDLAKYNQNGWITVQKRKHGSFNREDAEIHREDEKAYLASQGIPLDEFLLEEFPENAQYSIILKKGPVGFFTENVYTGPPTIRLDLGGGNFVDQRRDAVTKDRFGFNQSYLFRTGDDRLLIFDRLAQRATWLTIAPEQFFRGQNLKFIRYPGEKETHFLTSFSPSGSLLALTDQDGALHFVVREDDRWQYQGALDGRTKVPTPKAMLLKDLYLISLLDDDNPQKPLALLLAPNQAEQLVVARLDLKQGRVDLMPQPAGDETAVISAFALSADNQAVVSLEDGHLWFVDMMNGHMRPGGLQNKTAWAALAFSPNGSFLAMVDKAGQVTVTDKDGKMLWRQSSGLNNIKEVAVDDAGRRVWILETGSYDSSPKLAFVSPVTGPRIVDLAKRGASSSISGLRYDQTEDRAVVWSWKKDDNFTRTKTTSQEKVPLEEVQATIKIFSCVQADEQRFDESYGNQANPNPLLGVSPNGKTVILEGWYEYTQAWQPHYALDLSLQRVFRFNPRNVASSMVTSTTFSDDGRLVALGELGSRLGSRFLVYNLRTGDLLAGMLDASKHPLGIRHIAFLHHRPQRLLTVGAEGSLRLWDLTAPEPANLLTWIFFKNGNTAVVGRDSRFDTPEIDQLDGVHWVLDSLPGRTVALASLMRAYYQPRLAEYVLAGKKLPELPPLDGLNMKQHGVRLIGVETEKAAPGQVAVTVEVYVRDQDPNHPAQELKLFRDGQLVGKYSGENGGLFDLPEGKKQVTFRNISLPQSKNQVKFKAWTFNNDGVRSKYFDRPYSYTPVAKASPRLHLMAFGVNNFDNPAWDLKYAVNDARGFATILPAALPTVKSDVRLLAGGEGPGKPSKENLRAALENLGAVSSPDDVVVLAVSSHGLTDGKENKFYILPADIPGQEKKVTPELMVHSISADELGEWLTKVDAAEMVLILDTCQSGAALGGETFKPGPMGDKGLGQMAYDKAMRVLSATNENNAAMELGNLGHGLLSYALLVDGLERGMAGSAPGQGFTLKDWLLFGKKRTSELYARIAKGENVGDTRGRVKVDKAADNANPPLGQEPYLFDFGGTAREIVKFQVR
jgi:WD40 repeat protein